MGYAGEENVSQEKSGTTEIVPEDSLEGKTGKGLKG